MDVSVGMWIMMGVMMGVMMGGLAFAWIRSLRRRTKDRNTDASDQQG
jgi:preprotein translocase subunit YajC